MVQISNEQTPRFLIAGELQRDFLVLPSGEMHLDVLGGNALYAAVGLAVWENTPPPGLVARVGVDFPLEWLEKIKSKGINPGGVHIIPQKSDSRFFCAYQDTSGQPESDPLVFFARTGHQYPKELLGFSNKTTNFDSRSQLSPDSLRQGDFPSEFLGATAAHICPIDYLSHSLLPAVLRQAGFTLITLNASSGYMKPSFLDKIPALITGLTAFLCADDDIMTLFQGRIEDLWEMVEGLASYGCEMIVLTRGERGQLVYDGSTHSRYEVPAYPVKVIDPTGAGDAFCGGFLAGYRRTFDPLQATLYGNISASLVIEGHGVFYALDALPELAQARLDALRGSARKV